MRRPVRGHQPVHRHPGITLRGGQAGVAQQLLHGAQVGSAVDEMGGVAVAQHVGRHRADVQPGLRGPTLQDQPCPLTGQATAPLVEKHRVGIVPAGASGLLGQRGSTGVEVGGHRGQHRTADRQDALLGTLPHHPHQRTVQVDVTQGEPHRLRHPHAGPIEQLEQCPVAQRRRIRAVDAVEQRADHLHRQGLGHGVGHTDAVKIDRRVGHAQLLGPKPIPTAHRGDRPGHR